MFKEKPCQHCGHYPVNHNLSWITETLSVFLSSYDEFAMNSFFGYTLRKLFYFTQIFLFHTLRFFQVLKINRDPKLAVSPRARVMWEEADRRGIRMESTTILGKPIDMYRAYFKNGKNILFVGLPRPEKRRITTWSDDKAMLSEKLHIAGIPVPKGKSVTTFQEAMKIFREIEKPVIVKPRLGSRGRHTSTHLTNANELKDAFKIAQELCQYVIVQEHLFGSVYRGTVIDGKLVGVLQGNPPRVTGDGKHTIEELIEIKNKTRRQRVEEYKITDLTETFLSRQGYTLSSIPPKDTVLDLSEKVGIPYGGTTREMLSETHPKVKEMLEEAAKIIDDPVLGFDFIIDDPTKDPTGKHWGIIEANTLPFINIHHEPIEGIPSNVAKHVWDLWEK